MTTSWWTRWARRISEPTSHRLRLGRIAKPSHRSKLSRRFWVELLEERCLFAAGALDATFGTNGRVLTDYLGPYDARAVDVAVQFDNKVIVASSGVREAARTDIVLTRYNPDGSLDTNFNTQNHSGTVITDLAGTLTPARLALQSDHKILVAGTFASNGSNSDFFLARYNVDGSLDTTFGTLIPGSTTQHTGTVTTDFNSGTDTAAALAVQANGKIVVVGSTKSNSFFSSSTSFALARYNADGSLDTSFSGDGKLRNGLSITSRS